MTTLTVEHGAPGVATPVSLTAASLAIGSVALCMVAVFFRAWHLGNIPGCNGDEAWQGVQALRFLRGESIDWFTPTGNPINGFFFLPLLGLHALAPPSFALLRLTPFVSGLAALVANYLLCRRAFDTRTAAVSTLILALAPIDIVYSRFAWDASQTLLATLFVLYLPLIAVRDRGAVSLASVLALAAAIWVHPTNVFAAPLLVVPILYLRRREILATVRNAVVPDKTAIISVLVVSIATAVCVILNWLPTLVARCHGPQELGIFALYYLQLFSGTTIYEFVSGSASGSTHLDHLVHAEAIDVVFAAVVLSALWGLFHRWQHEKSDTDAGLVIGWLVMLVGFFVVAGPGAIAPHFERYGMCLVGPGAVVLARGLAWWIDGRQPHANRVAAALVVLGWLWVASFYVNYFACFERTGGRSHLTFRTAAVEPKLAAIDAVLAQRKPNEPTRIVCHEWWNYWPIEYLALGQENVRALTWDQWQRERESMVAAGMRNTWFVEFADSAAEHIALVEYRHWGLTTRRQTICDYSGRPLIVVIGESE